MQGLNDDNSKIHDTTCCDKLHLIWRYEGQLGAVECVLGRADQLIIETCILEEMEQLHRNLVLFYDYKKKVYGMAQEFQHK